MARTMDFLDLLWTNCVNPDTAGRWIEAAIKQGSASEGSFLKKYGDALSSLRQKVSAKELGSMARLARYEACFAMLSALEDPGPPACSIRNLVEQLESLQEGGRIGKVGQKYFTALGVLDFLKPDGQWFLKLAEQPKTDAPFGDVGPIVKLSLKAGATAQEIGIFASGCYFQAVVHAHQLLDQAGLTESEDFAGLHESFLAADPSGLEGRPGSWPMPTKRQAAAGRVFPMWKVRAGQAIAFSPDGKRVAIAGASGPARIFDSVTGSEMVCCEGPKAHISHLAFSTSGAQLAVTEMYDRAAVCDAYSGKLVAKNFFPKPVSEWEGISSLVYSQNGELLRSAWRKNIEVVDAKSFGILPSPPPPQAARSVDSIAFFPDGKKLAAISRTRKEGEASATIWQWPTQQVLLNVKFVAGILSNLAVSPDGTMFAVQSGSFEYLKIESTVYLFEAASGKVLKCWRGPRGPGIVFTPENLLIAGHDSHVWMANIKEDSAPRAVPICPETASIYQIACSHDGKLLGVAGSNGASVWDIQSLWNCAQVI